MNTIHEDMRPPTITRVTIGPMPMTVLDAPPAIHAWFSNGTDKNIFTYYPDEISFQESELVGLTEAQARQLRRQKDMQYLQDLPEPSPYFTEDPADLDEEATEFFSKSALDIDYYP